MMNSLIQMQNSWWLFLILMLWVLPWKGYALWTSAKLNHKVWFVVLLILNTFAIVDILYIFYFAKKKPKQIVEDLNSNIK